VNLLGVGIPVQYQITNILDWAYNYNDSERLLEKVSTREVVHYLVNADVQEIMSSARFEAGDELRTRIQNEAERLKLGVKILLVGMADVHPPVQVAASFESVVAARHKGNADILSAQAYAVRTNSVAASMALQMEQVAESARNRLATEAGSRAALFTNQVPAYKVAPEVYTERAFLQVLQRGSSQARKVVLATTNAQNVMTLNLEQKYRPDMVDLTMPDKDKKK
jgi:membrane protease subunit HflK